MTVLGVLLEGFDDAKHPRGYHGRFIGAGSDRVLRVMHGDTHIGDVKSPEGQERVQTMLGVGRVVGARRHDMTGRTISTKQIADVVDKATGGTPPRPATPGRASADSLARNADYMRAAELRAGAAHRKGDLVHVVTPQGHVERGVVEKPAETYDAITSKGTERSTTVQVRWQDGDVTHERPQDLEPGHKYSSIESAARAGALPSQRDKTGTPTTRKFDSIGAAARAGALLSQQPGSAPPPLPANAPERRQPGAVAPADRHGGFKIGDVVTHEMGSRSAGGHGPVTFTKQPGLSTVVGLQRNGNLRLKHPDTGTTHDVHYSHAQKVSPLHPDYRGKVVQDAYAAQRGAIEKAARARRSGLSESLVLGALLEGR